MVTPKNILIIKLSSIGDVIHALPVSYALKKNFPDAKISWIVEKPAMDLLAGNPCVDDVILFDKPNFKTVSGFLKNFPPLKKKLKEKHFDISIDLQGLGKSAAVAFCSGAPVRVGTSYMRELSGCISKPIVGAHTDKTKAHVVEQLLDVVRSLGCEIEEGQAIFPIDISDDEKKNALAILEKNGVPQNAKFAILATGAGWATKQWPAKYFAQLSDWLYEKKIIPVFTGHGLAEEQKINEIFSQTEIPPVSLCNQTKLRQLAYLLKKSCFVFGGDTGIVHLGAAVKAKCIMVMGPTEGWRTGPYGQLQNVLNISRPCKACRQRVCPKQFDCLSDVTVERVIKKIEEII